MSAFEDDEAPCLVTNYSFDKRDYLIKMFVKSNILKLSIIDNTTSEKWVCSYNSMYIEELTRRTGNYKKFSVFVTMLNSGILRTNSSVRIELMSHSELELLSDKNKYKNRLPAMEEDPRKYLILVYTVEFDKIHYPLPLEYCGMPNPRILQKRIQYLEKEKRRLENELTNAVCTKCNTQLPVLEERVCKLVEEKQCLEDEVKCLAAELGSRYNNARIPAWSDEKHYLQEKIKLLQQENNELITTLDIMNKRLNNYGGHKLVANQVRKCDKCAALPVKSKPVRNSKICTPNASPSRRRNIFPKYSADSSISSASSDKNSAIKGRKTRRKISSGRLRLDGNLSSTSFSENSVGLLGRNSARRKPIKSNSNANRSPKIPGGNKIGQPTQILRRNINKFPPQMSSSKTQHTINNIVTPDDLRKQINELVKVVESWSSNLNGPFHNF